MNTKIETILEKYLAALPNQSETDRESNEIYGEILSILTKNPNINLYELIALINREGVKFEKNKIRNRRDRITAIHKSLEEANLIVEKLKKADEKSFNEIEEILKVSNIYRNRMVLSLLLEENFTEEFYEVYYGIKSEQCKGFINALIVELKK